MHSSRGSSKPWLKPQHNYYYYYYLLPNAQTTAKSHLRANRNTMNAIDYRDECELAQYLT